MCHKLLRVRVMVMMFNTTINNISVISWRSVLLVEETAVHGENPQPVERNIPVVICDTGLFWSGSYGSWIYNCLYNKSI
jgi:hypothetical protein